MPRRPEPIFSPDAHRQLRRLPVHGQRRIVDAVRLHLVREDPAATTRHKFRLRRSSVHADYELRVEDMRVFYRITSEGGVVVTLIGIKRGKRLIVNGKEFTL